jgi:hypothetical protein
MGKAVDAVMVRKGDFGSECARLRGIQKNYLPGELRQEIGLWGGMFSIKAE